MKLTKSIIDKITSPRDKGQAFYRDDTLRGFALRVTKRGSKSFVVEKLINGKVKRLTVGRYGELTTEQARKEAQKIMGKIASGIDPVKERQAAKVKGVTLKETFSDYLKARKDLKRKTLYDYERIMQTVFLDWQNRVLISVTKEQIAKRHTLVGEKRGTAYANLSMRLLRALFNFASGQYEDDQGHSLIAENPVRRLSQTRAWYRIERRQSFIKKHELAAWYQGLEKLQNETLKDYLLLILFTGLRRQEAAKLRWDSVDLKAKTLTINDTKNNQSHTLPLSNFLFDLLKRREVHKINDYVFSGTGKYGYIIEPRKQIAKVISYSEVHFTVHDLRRTFITIAESLDIPVYALKKLLNHRMSNDVTAGYVVIDVDRLRKPMQMITDFLVNSIKTDKE